MQRGGGGRRASAYTIEYDKAKADAARDALIKSIYTHLFDWVVSKVRILCGPACMHASRRTSSIGWSPR